MKIELSNGYYLEGYGMGVTLTQRYLSKKNTETNRVVGHYDRLSHALKRLLEERISESDAFTIEQLRDDVLRFYSEIEKTFPMVLQNCCFDEAKLNPDG